MCSSWPWVLHWVHKSGTSMIASFLRRTLRFITLTNFRVVILRNVLGRTVLLVQISTSKTEKTIFSEGSLTFFTGIRLLNRACYPTSWPIKVKLLTWKENLPNCWFNSAGGPPLWMWGKFFLFSDQIKTRACYFEVEWATFNTRFASNNKSTICLF